MNPDEYVKYYLQQLKTPDAEDAWHYLIEGGTECLRPLLVAYNDSNDTQERVEILSMLPQFHDSQVLPVLIAALSDSNQEIWKAAIDGLCAAGGEGAMTALSQERDRCAATTPDAKQKLEWLDEAIEQVSERRL